MFDVQLAIPEKLENLTLPAPELLTFYKLAESRIVWIDDDIEDNCIEIERMIHLWNMEDAGIPIDERKPIKLFIYSDGGDITIMYSLVATIEQSSTPIWTINAGWACSAAALILLSGDKGHRYAYKRSIALIHNGSGQAGGTFDQTEAYMKMYKNLVAMMHEMILEKTNIDAATLKKKKSTEWFMSADDQVTNGLVDKIITSLEEII